MILTSSVAPRFPTKGVLLFALPYREPKEAGGRNVTNSQLWLANNLSDGQCRCVRFALRARHSSDQRRRREPQSESNITWTGRSGYGYEQGSNPPSPPGSPMVHGCRQSLVGNLLERWPTNAGGPIPPAGRRHHHIAGAKKERRTHGGHQKTIRATKDQVLRGGVVHDRAQLSAHTGGTGCPNRYV